MKHIADFLTGLPLFKGFTRATLEEMIGRSSVRRFSRQEPIIRFSQPGEFLGIILEGSAEVVLAEGTGDKHLDVLMKGDMIGEMSLLTGEPTGADVLAQSACTVLVIPHQVYTSYLATNPVALQVMAKTITTRLKKRAEDDEDKARVEHAWRSASDPYGLSLTPTMPMKLLILNANRHRLHFKYYDTEKPMHNRQGSVWGLDKKTAILTVQEKKRGSRIAEPDHDTAVRTILDYLVEEAACGLESAEKLDAVGHRVVHGGEVYDSATVIDAGVIRDIEKLGDLAPDNNPYSARVIKCCNKALPGGSQVAVFETGFHRRMPSYAYLYGLPYRLYEKEGIRRYGSHGISHHYVALQGASFIKENFRRLKIITCHLGHRSSICAIDHGRTIDTSLGFTLQGGLMDDTRPGDLDPGIFTYLRRKRNYTDAQIRELMDGKSGLYGLSGIKGKFSDLETAANAGNEAAVRAIHTYCYRIRKYIGAYVAALGGLDVLVFTGSVGTQSAWVRGLACQGLYHLGIQIDDAANARTRVNSGDVVDISTEKSRVKVLTIPLDDERMVARETVRMLSYQAVAQLIKQQKKEIPIEVSAHHLHLCQEHVEVLFGPNHTLTPLKELSQPGQFACEETVNLVGPKGKVNKLRVLGPVRKESQVEISITEEFKLGIKAPIRASGDLDGTPGITLEGPAGTVTIDRGVINALRHIHMTPQDALAFGLKDRDVVMVKVPGDRELIFGDVLVRAQPDYKLAMHLDTDEANAANLGPGAVGIVMGIQDRR